jgi:hypothetical protein
VGKYKDSEGEIELTRRGFRLATSVGGTLTGRGGNVIIIDDPNKPQDASFRLLLACNALEEIGEDRLVLFGRRAHPSRFTGFAAERR